MIRILEKKREHLDIQTFEALLKKAEIDKKQFATETGLVYNSVTNWSSKGTVPDWVNSWLENYIDASISKKAANMLLRAHSLKIEREQLIEEASSLLLDTVGNNEQAPVKE